MPKSLNDNKAIEIMQPVFTLWADTHSTADAIIRFKSILPEYAVLRLTENFLKEVV